MTSNSTPQPRILIVEDEPLIASVFSDAILDAGYAVAGIASKVADALAIIEAGACDGAVLDPTLFGVSSAPIADALAARGIRYLVISGFTQEQLPDIFRGAPYLRKPVRLPQLFEAMDTLFPKK